MKNPIKIVYISTMHILFYVNKILKDPAKDAAKILEKRWRKKIIWKLELTLFFNLILHTQYVMQNIFVF